MPLVAIEIVKGKTKTHKKAIMNSVEHSIIQTLEVTKDDLFQRVLEFEEEDFLTPSDRTDNATLIEIILYKGSSPKVKKNLNNAIIENLAASPGINASDLPLSYWNLPKKTGSLKMVNHLVKTFRRG